MKVGIVQEVVEYKDNNKAVVLIKDELKNNNSWAVEFRKHLRKAALMLIPGDRIQFESYNQGCIDKNKKFHNNIIAESVKRV